VWQLALSKHDSLDNAPRAVRGQARQSIGTISIERVGSIWGWDGDMNGEPTGTTHPSGPVRGPVCGSYVWLALAMVGAETVILTICAVRWGWPPEAVIGGIGGMLILTAVMRGWLQVTVLDDRLVYFSGINQFETYWSEVESIEPHRFRANLVFKEPQRPGLITVRKRGFIYLDPKWPQRPVAKAVIARVKLQQEMDSTGQAAPSP
jgi:hypothetical protein